MSVGKRHILAIAILALLLIAAIVGWFLRHEDQTWERLQRGGSLRVAVDPSFPPFENVDDSGQLLGFDIDLARELGARLGAPVEFKAIAFDGLVDAVIAGKADVVISAFPLDPRLNEDIRYSQPYFEGGLVLVVREESEVAGPDDLVGRKIAVEWGSLGDAWARSNGLDIDRNETPQEALQAVAESEADAAVVDAVTAALSAPPGLRILDPPLESDPYVIVLSPRSPRLAQAVDETLAEIMEDGTWERLLRTYFSLEPPRPGS